MRSSFSPEYRARVNPAWLSTRCSPRADGVTANRFPSTSDRCMRTCSSCCGPTGSARCGSRGGPAAHRATTAGQAQEALDRRGRGPARGERLCATAADRVRGDRARARRRRRPRRLRGHRPRGAGTAAVLLRRAVGCLPRVHRPGLTEGGRPRTRRTGRGEVAVRGRRRAVDEHQRCRVLHPTARSGGRGGRVQHRRPLASSVRHREEGGAARVPGAGPPHLSTRCPARPAAAPG